MISSSDFTLHQIELRAERSNVALLSHTLFINVVFLEYEDSKALDKITFLAFFFAYYYGPTLCSKQHHRYTRSLVVLTRWFSFIKAYSYKCSIRCSWRKVGKNLKDIEEQWRAKNCLSSFILIQIMSSAPSKWEDTTKIMCEQI